MGITWDEMPIGWLSKYNNIFLFYSLINNIIFIKYYQVYNNIYQIYHMYQVLSRTVLGTWQIFNKLLLKERIGQSCPRPSWVHANLWQKGAEESCLSSQSVLMPNNAGKARTVSGDWPLMQRLLKQLGESRSELRHWSLWDHEDFLGWPMVSKDYMSSNVVRLKLRWFENWPVIFLTIYLKFFLSRILGQFLNSRTTLNKAK